MPAQVDEWLANSPSNLPSSDTPLARRSSAPAEASAGSLAGSTPLTTKLAPGSVWNAAAKVGSLTQSCAQAKTSAQHQRRAGIEGHHAVVPPAELGASVGAAASGIGERKAATVDVGLAVAGGAENCACTAP